MEVFLFTMLVYGITNIMVFAYIFEGWRDFWERVSPKFFGKLFTCPLCTSFWVGIFLSISFTLLGYPTPFLLYGLKEMVLRAFADACFVSGCVWVITWIEKTFENGAKELKDS